VIAFSLHAIGDPARQEARIQEVYDEFNLSGEGVIIAILDRGIDYTHPAFLNADGTTRVAYIYDMINDAGAGENPYGIGTIFDEVAINAALMAGGTPISTDFGGHGTATNSIAAGNGMGSSIGLDTRGVAFNATIISVKLINDPFPAANGQAGQAGFFNPDYIDEALQFVHDKGVELGMPVVTLMNFGSIGGPTDGTSAVCQAMEDFIAQGNLLVCGVGDDGGADNAAEGIIQSGVTEVVDVRKEVPGNLRFELWYPGSDLLDLLIVRPDESSTPIIFDDEDPNHATNDIFTDMSIFRRGTNVDFAGAASDRKQILIDITGDTGVYRIHLSTPQMTDVNFFASLNPALYNNGSRFLNFVRE
ncbi:MAG: S8 family serine peptidase, partial [Bacteroidota bacterium]